MYLPYKSRSAPLMMATFLLVSAVLAVDYQRQSLTTRSSFSGRNENNTPARASGLASAIRPVVPDSGSSLRSYRIYSGAGKPKLPSTEAGSEGAAKTGAEEHRRVAQRESLQLADSDDPTDQPSPRGKREDERQYSSRSQRAGIALYLWILTGAARRPP
jgi:hypothetical protein